MRPLKGVTVVTIEQAVAAPLCSARLRDAGARVIKIERAEGDFGRNYDTAAKGDSSYFVWLNQDKESFVLDFKSAEGEVTLRTLLSEADVFIQNLAPGAIKRAGFGYEALRLLYPSLITCDISGYGDSEALKDMRAYDLLVQAESGLASITGGVNEMGRIGVSICDIGAGMTAHAAILEALYRRKDTGEGASLKVSLFDVAAEWMAVPLIHSDYGNGAPKREGLRHPSIAPYGAYATGDGVETLISIQNEREWSRFCDQVLQKPEIAIDEEFTSNKDRVIHRKRLDAIILKSLSSIKAEEFRSRLYQHKIAFGAVNSVADVSAHQAMRKREVYNSKGAPLMVPDHPVVWADEDWRSVSGAPEIGEHNTQIEDFVESLKGSK